MSNTISWRRHAVGAISLALVVAAIVIWFIPGASTNWAFAQGVFMKSGTTLLILWLAYPQLERLQWWKVISVLAVATVFVFFPQSRLAIFRVVIFAVPIFFVIQLLRMPAKRRSQ